MEVDMEGTCGTESPYVMLSRAKSLDGVFILRPFRLATIQRHPSQDVRDEFKRLDMLCHQTVIRFGLAAEASESQNYLVNTFSAAALPIPAYEAGPDARRLSLSERMVLFAQFSSVFLKIKT
jgi:hypothetical protein